jgi:hypothetical protein
MWRQRRRPPDNRPLPASEEEGGTGAALLYVIQSSLIRGALRPCR